MTPGELLTVIDHALAKPPGRRGAVLELTAPVVLGVPGKYLGESDRGPVYGYTKRQCRRIRDVIYAAARADMGSG